MIEYRKAGMRTFYCIDNGKVLKVFNRESLSQIMVSDRNELIASDAMDGTLEITQQEFNDQYQIAIERITKMKI